MRETTYGGRCEKHLRAKPCELCFVDLDAGRPQLPSRDSSKPAEQQGLFRKFDVRRTDGSSEPGGKHEGCEYFVLDVDHDPLARVALQAYADACDATHPQLSQDLRRRYGLTVLPVEPPQRPALVTALRGLLASLQREPTEFELRAVAHEFTVMADRIAAGRSLRHDEEGSGS